MPVSTAPIAPQLPEKKVNWELAKGCLAELSREAPSILSQGVIIGGIACWFYRHLLSKTHDADFKVPVLSAAQEELWLSKDIDFTNFFAQDARDLLKKYVVQDSQGRLQVKLANIPIGFAQVGVTFDPESAWTESWIGTFTWEEKTVQCRILDPISLYREKQALSQRRGYESDRLHCAVVAEYLRYETCQQASVLATAKFLEERTKPLKFLFAIRDRTLEICHDERVHRRVREAISQAPSMTTSESTLLGELANGAQPSSESL
ncbi:MAG TPA: hypothetical protein VFC44_11275 [Candidatus Saccharimonadales bacterium]|nr:hypothetical protein [Candidatus Saccharimonadales bacterium]